MHLYTWASDDKLSSHLNLSSHRGKLNFVKKNTRFQSRNTKNYLKCAEKIGLEKCSTCNIRVTLVCPKRPEQSNQNLVQKPIFLFVIYVKMYADIQNLCFLFYCQMSAINLSCLALSGNDSTSTLISFSRYYDILLFLLGTSNKFSKLPKKKIS